MYNDNFVNVRDRLGWKRQDDPNQHPSKEKTLREGFTWVPAGLTREKVMIAMVVLVIVMRAGGRKWKKERVGVGSGEKQTSKPPRTQPEIRLCVTGSPGFLQDSLKERLLAAAAAAAMVVVVVVEEEEEEEEEEEMVEGFTWVPAGLTREKVMMMVVVLVIIMIVLVREVAGK